MSDDLTLLERLLGVQKEEYNWDAGYGEDEHTGLPGLSCSASLLRDEDDARETRDADVDADVKDIYRGLSERQRYTLWRIPKGSYVPIKKRWGLPEDQFNRGTIGALQRKGLVVVSNNGVTLTALGAYVSTLIEDEGCQGIRTWDLRPKSRR